MTKDAALLLADRILALINAQPRTPTREEIADLLSDEDDGAPQLSGDLDAGSINQGMENVAVDRLIDDFTASNIETKGSLSGTVGGMRLRYVTEEISKAEGDLIIERVASGELKASPEDQKKAQDYLVKERSKLFLPRTRARLRADRAEQERQDAAKPRVTRYSYDEDLVAWGDPLSIADDSKA